MNEFDSFKITNSDFKLGKYVIQSNRDLLNVNVRAWRYKGFLLIDFITIFQ
jgi:hypothetical protein